MASNYPNDNPNMEQVPEIDWDQIQNPYLQTDENFEEDKIKWKPNTLKLKPKNASALKLVQMVDLFPQNYYQLPRHRLVIPLRRGCGWCSVTCCMDTEAVTCEQQKVNTLENNYKECCQILLDSQALLEPTEMAILMLTLSMMAIAIVSKIRLRHLEGFARHLQHFYTYLIRELRANSTVTYTMLSKAREHLNRCRRTIGNVTFTAPNRIDALLLDAHNWQNAEVLAHIPDPAVLVQNVFLEFDQE